MRVAFTSSDGRLVDEHFGRASHFFMWEVEPDSAECLGSIELPTGEGVEDGIVKRADALEGCVMVCTLQIGGPAAARLAARHVHPLKITTEAPLVEVVRKLQSVLRFGPPPWLRKTLVGPRVGSVSDSK